MIFEPDIELRLNTKGRAIELWTRSCGRLELVDAWTVLVDDKEQPHKTTVLERKTMPRRKQKNAKAGLNGNVHRYAAHDPQGELKKLRVEYLGDGDWSLPKGAKIRHIGEDGWGLEMPDGKEFSVWTEN